MTLKEAMAYRGENADTLAEKIGIRAGEITKWMRPAGLLRVPSARLQQLAVALDGGVLVTADGVEVELYGSGGNAQMQNEPQALLQKGGRKARRAGTGGAGHGA